jgi:CubicO group peptidase (beta-lactamase class C family)
MKYTIWIRLLVIIALVLSLSACGKAAPSTKTIPPVENLNDYLQPMLDRFHLPALAALVISDGNIIAQADVGVRKYGDTTPITIDDQWLLGPCTQGMTATVIAMLVEQGKLNWTTTMADIYPELKDQMLPKYRDVTILELLSYHAGLAGPGNSPDLGYPPGTTPDYWYGLTEPITQQRYEYTKDFLCQPDSPAVDALPAPGTTFLYSNAGYVIAGAVAEQVTGKSWETLMTTMLFQPLGMTTAGFGVMGTDNQVDQPWMHSYADNQITPIPPEDGSHLEGLAPVLWPAAGVHVSLQDWAKFIMIHLEGEQGGSTLLKPATFKILHMPPFDTGAGFAPGWALQASAYGMALVQQGSFMVNLIGVYMLPGSDLAVLVTTNIYTPETGAAFTGVLMSLITKFLPSK